MIIQDMTQQEIKEFLARATIGRLACAKDNQPYVIPLSFAYDDVSLYSLTSAGTKVDWMRENPKVCIEFDEIVATNNWQSVVVTGIFEELTSEPGHIEARNNAHRLLSRTAEWWEPAYVKTISRNHVRPLEPVYFRVAIIHTTGHKTVAS
ncbi:MULTISPECIES: pyridoxamine 5'-phosphate oxidase family protein [unclassified Phyllobacterium]|uniref:pyridoxamine 5'-phosphate oxidase family protein n=1 Tax=unclassified Phyllobacterium TaxID=2638441 RepID=UPI003012C747